MIDYTPFDRISELTLERDEARQQAQAALQNAEGIDPDMFTLVCFERDEAQAKLRAAEQQVAALREALDAILKFKGSWWIATLPVDVREKVRAALAATEDGVEPQPTARDNRYVAHEGELHPKGES